MRTALVTGATGGIGRLLVKGLVENGYHGIGLLGIHLPVQILSSGL